MTDVKDTRTVTAGWLNYRGDLRDSFDMNRPYGPRDDLDKMRSGEMLWPLVIEYMPEANMTRVGFTFQAPPVVMSQAEALKGTGKRVD